MNAYLRNPQYLSTESILEYKALLTTEFGTCILKKTYDRRFDSDCLHEQSKEFVSLFGEYQEIHYGVIRDTGSGISVQQGEFGEGDERFPMGYIH